MKNLRDFHRLFVEGVLTEELTDAVQGWQICPQCVLMQNCLRTVLRRTAWKRIQQPEINKSGRATDVLKKTDA